MRMLNKTCNSSEAQPRRKVRCSFWLKGKQLVLFGIRSRTYSLYLFQVEITVCQLAYGTYYPPTKAIQSKAEKTSFCYMKEKNCTQAFHDGIGCVGLLNRAQNLYHTYSCSLAL